MIFRNHRKIIVMPAVEKLSSLGDFDGFCKLAGHCNPFIFKLNCYDNKLSSKLS
jgi:hypothetical protein